MICKHCREGARLALPEFLATTDPFTTMSVTYPYSARQSHERCREYKRQQAAQLTATELAGGSWCDCQHNTPVPGKP